MDFSGYLSNVKINLTFPSNLWCVRVKSSTVQMRFQFTPIQNLMQRPTRIFAFFIIILNSFETIRVRLRLF